MAAHDDTSGSEGGEPDGAGGGATDTTPPKATTSAWTRFRSIFRAPTREDREFAAFHREHARFVWGILHQHLRVGPHEELHQDVFVEVWRIKKSGEPIDSVRGLLHGVTIRKIGNYMQLRRLPADGATSSAEVGDPLDPEQHAIVDARKRVVEETLANMPPGPKQAFTLIELEGKTDQEVAELLGRPLGTEKSWKSKARALLAEAAQAHMRAEEGVDKK
jgi:RNA polymerase sigma factor (sigma-70 family)